MIYNFVIERLITFQVIIITICVMMMINFIIIDHHHHETASSSDVRVINVVIVQAIVVGVDHKAEETYISLSVSSSSSHISIIIIIIIIIRLPCRGCSQHRMGYHKQNTQYQRSPSAPSYELSSLSNDIISRT